MRKELKTNSAEETEALGAALAARLGPGSVVALFGGLGAGKTAFVRGLAAGLACCDQVSSPTYALVHEYAGPLPLVHFDMYRITCAEDLDSTGFYDYLAQPCAMAIEWSENIAYALPPHCVRVTILPGKDENTRLIVVEESWKS